MTGHRQCSLAPGWVVTTLSELLTVMRGVSYDKADARDAAGEALVPILRATNIATELTFDDLVYVPTRCVASDQLLQVGDIVVAASSGSRAVVGKAAPLTRPWHGSFGAFCYALRPSGCLHAGFLAYYLQTAEYRNRVSELSAGVNINNLRRQHIEETPISLPPLPEQRRIVAEIEAQFARLEAGVAALQRVQANLKRYRAAVLRAACEGRLVPTEAELARADGRDYEPAEDLLVRIRAERRLRWEADQVARMCAQGTPPKDDRWKSRYRDPSSGRPVGLPEVPKGWLWVTLDTVCTRVVDGVHKKPDYVSSGIPFVTVRNLTAGPSISFEHLNHITPQDHAEFIKRANPEPGDLLVSKDGTLGVVRLIRTERTFSIFVSVALVKPVLRGLSEYLYCALSSPQVQAQMVPKGSGLQHIHLEDLRADYIPLAPLPEQRRIVAEVQRRLSIIEEIEAMVAANLKRAERLRQAILKRAFEGKLVPQDPNDEPASVLLERIRAERMAANGKGLKRGVRRSRTSEDEHQPELNLG